MPIVKVTKIIDLFFTLNSLEGRDSVELEESNYTDNYFRWTKDSFKHKQKITVIYNDSRITMFNTQKVRERLGANLDKIQNDDSKTNFGCSFNIVKDLIHIINVEEIDDDEVKELKKPIIIKKTKRQEYDEMLGRTKNYK